MTRCTTALLAGVLLDLAPVIAWAQAYPSKPVKFVTASPPGGAPDVMARLISQKMNDAWGVQVIVENRTGAGGSLAAEFVAKAAPDGHTVLLHDNSVWAINPHLYSRLAYDPFKDFAPVTLVGVAPLFLVVNPSVPPSNIQELIAYAKANPGKLSYASASNGSIHHLTAELFKSMAGIDILRVPYKGGNPGVTALIAGEVQMMFVGYPLVAPSLSTGRLRLLAISTAQRSPSHPGVPTVAEAGLPGFDMSASIGVLAPASTPREVIAKLNAGIATAVAMPEFASRMAAFGIVVTATSSEQFAALIRAEYEKFARLFKLSGARID